MVILLIMPHHCHLLLLPFTLTLEAPHLTSPRSRQQIHFGFSVSGLRYQCRLLMLRSNAKQSIRFLPAFFVVKGSLWINSNTFIMLYYCQRWNTALKLLFLLKKNVLLSWLLSIESLNMLQDWPFPFCQFSCIHLSLWA